MNHFRPTFLYICIVSSVVLAYVVAVTFIPIPKENQRFVDIALAFLLGLLAGQSNYLTGGNPTTKKPDNQSGTTQVDLSVSTQTPVETPTEIKE